MAYILKQNKHVLRPSSGKGHQTNSVTRQFILSARSGAYLRLNSMYAIILEKVRESGILFSGEK
jgi:hypothetical protein